MPTGQGGVPAAFRPFAGLVAAGATILLVPQVWPVIEPPVREAIFDLYGHEYAAWLFLAAEIGFWPLIFFALRLGIMGALMWLYLTAARRLM
jgi:hypothetical protein